MKSSRITIALALAVITIFAVAGYAKTTAPKSHGLSVHGTITAYDEKAHTLAITPAKGTATTLMCNDATKVHGGSLKVGEMAEARYLVRGGKNVATVITVPAAQQAKTKAATPAVKK